VSWWLLPTTADVGIRAFSADAAGAMAEAALGLQAVQISESTLTDLSDLAASTAEWEVEVPNGDLERGLVRWLEEVLYRGGAEGQWMVDASISIVDGAIRAKVSWTDTNNVDLVIEVKAITLHELVLREVALGEVVVGVEPEIPSFEGPGWMAQVILDV
tara:strand:- start:506 stop:982 length:477 start_codon:yes stop_codon:yes gene_type:complete